MSVDAPIIGASNSNIIYGTYAIATPDFCFLLPNVILLSGKTRPIV